jgi:hypothetical protein
LIVAFKSLLQKNFEINILQTTIYYVIKAYQEDKLSAYKALHNYKKAIWVERLDFIDKQLTPLLLFFAKSDLEILLIISSAMFHLKAYSHQFMDYKDELLSWLFNQEKTLIHAHETIFLKVGDKLVKENGYEFTDEIEIQSLPGCKPIKYKCLKKDGVEIHFQITVEGTQVYLCLPGRHESNHRFIEEQDLYQGDAYLVNKEKIFFSSEKPYTENDIKELLDLAHYGSLILYYAKEKEKAQANRA